MLTNAEATTVPYLGSDLERVERRLAEVTSCQYGFLDEVTTYLARAGGKRLRPSLSLLTSYAQVGCDEPTPQAVVESATAVELLHLGSLYHDDVMDEANVRRGVPSVNARWDNGTAVLGGDILLARANGLSCRLGAEEGILAASTLDALCTGQALETRDLYDADRSLPAYFETIAGKTAALTSASCRFGALGAGMEPGLVERFTAIGHHLGMAFQVVDDILDVVSTEQELGKPTGTDVEEGVYTLPVLLAIDEEPDVRELLGPAARPAALIRAVESIRATSALARCAHIASAYIDAAQCMLRSQAEPLDGGAIDALLRIGERIMAPASGLLDSSAEGERGLEPAFDLVLPERSALLSYLERV